MYRVKHCSAQSFFNRLAGGGGQFPQTGPSRVPGVLRSPQLGPWTPPKNQMGPHFSQILRIYRMFAEIAPPSPPPPSTHTSSTKTHTIAHQDTYRQHRSTLKRLALCGGGGGSFRKLGHSGSQASSAAPNWDCRGCPRAKRAPASRKSCVFAGCLRKVPPPPYLGFFTVWAKRLLYLVVYIRF